ncbi:MAG: ABC transporter ATP-binding protein [Desulfobulbus propionicus]|nr:MAG: ABC transporter ATP-binding protein [Desulfobulbus propionicus]
MSSNVAIRIEHLSKCYQIYDQPRDRLMQMLMRGRRQYYHEFWALRDVSIIIEKGETVGIIGRNGSGKSTLLQLICGTLNRTTGNVYTNGRIAALLELGSGFNPDFTGRENVYMNASVLGLTRKEIDSRFESIASFAEIGSFLEQSVKTYSSGMLVRLAFAVAINVDPEILVVDEALSVGDELFQRKCFARIEEIRRGGATILFVSHSGGSIVELCDRALLLDAGEKLAVGHPKDIVGAYQKLLYAPQEKVAGIRETIIANSGKVSGEDEQEKDGPANTSPQIAPQADEPLNEDPLEVYDPHLIPSSTIEYEQFAAVIDAPAIRTVRGVQVNNIVSGRQYTFSYTVTFTRSASNVRFGMLIKTKAGIELGGTAATKSAGDTLSYVAAGQTYTVEFLFQCCLTAGVFFLNAGVMGNVDGKETYLHRLVDIAMFRVHFDTENAATGMIDFGCKLHLEKL